MWCWWSFENCIKREDDAPTSRYGHDGEDVEIEKLNKLLESDLIKIKRRHIMYASSYNALHFCYAADQRNLKAKDISRAPLQYPLTPPLPPRSVPPH